MIQIFFYGYKMYINVELNKSKHNSNNNKKKLCNKISLQNITTEAN